MDDSDSQEASPASSPEPEFVAWLRTLGPQYGFNHPVLLSPGPGGNVTVVAVLGTPEDGSRHGGSIHERLVRLIGDAHSRAAHPCPFTPAELEVLRWVRLGRTNREIGKILFKSEFTIKTHIHHMLAKTGLDNRLQLASLPIVDTQPR